MPTPTITAIITFYRHDRFFPEALASVLAQIPAPDEVIVVDDASPDEDRKTLANLPAVVQLYRQPVNSGPGAARRRATEMATGDYLAYLDADDVWCPGKLAAQLEYMERHPDAVACHTGTIAFAEDGSEKFYVNKPAAQTGAMSLIRGTIMPSALMVRRSVVNAIGSWSPDRRLVDDWDFEIRLTNQAGPLMFLPEPLTRIRRSGHGNLSSRALLNARCIAQVVWVHRNRNNTLNGTGAWRAVLAREWRSDSWKAKPLLRATMQLAAGLLRIGAPAIRDSV